MTPQLRIMPRTWHGFRVGDVVRLRAHPLKPDGDYLILDIRPGKGALLVKQKPVATAIRGQL